MKASQSDSGNGTNLEKWSHSVPHHPFLSKCPSFPGRLLLAICWLRFGSVSTFFFSQFTTRMSCCPSLELGWVVSTDLNCCSSLGCAVVTLPGCSHIGAGGLCFGRCSCSSRHDWSGFQGSPAQTGRSCFRGETRTPFLARSMGARKSPVCQGCAASWNWMLGLSQEVPACCGQVGRGPGLLLPGEVFPRLNSNR